LLRIKAVRAYLRMNRRPHFSPAIDRSVEPEFLDRSNRAIERDPRHHLRMGEVARAAPHFPDPLVGLPPDGFEMQEEAAFQSPGRIAGGESGAARDIKGVEHLAIDV